MPRMIKGICSTGSTERAVLAFDLAPARRGPSGSHSRDARAMPRATICLRSLSAALEQLHTLS
eukprot:601676-Rhodomonas_salina.1